MYKGEADIEDLKKIPLNTLVVQAGGKFKKRSGKNDFYFCPFHNSESGTSFRVETDKNVWICTQCGGGNGSKALGGTTIDFVMKWKDCEIGQAIEYLKTV